MKNRSKLISFLKLPAVIAANLILFPFICGLYWEFGHADITLCFRALIIAELSGVFGLYTSLILDKVLLKTIPIWRKGILLILLILFGVLGALVMKGGFALQFLSGLFSALAFLQGARNAPKGYTFLAKQIYLSTAIGANVAVGLIIAVINAFNKTSYDYYPMATVLLIFVILYAICENQASIDKMMARRGYEAGAFPPKVRRYSLYLTFLLAALLIGGYLLRKQIGWVVNLLLQIVKWPFIKLIDWFSNLSFYVRPVREEDKPLMLSGEEGTDFAWVLILLCVIAVAVLIFLNRREIIRFFRRLINRIKEWVSALFQLKEKKEKQGQEPEYTDRVETIMEKKKTSLSLPGAKKRRWKRAYKEYLKMDKGEIRVRKGFSLLRQGMALRGVKAPKNQTPSEFLQICRKILQEEKFPMAIEGYNIVRYAERQANEQIENAMDQTLRSLEKLL